MRYRKLSDSGDYVFGQGPLEFWSNVPDAVGQAVRTRLLLATGQWFLDTTDGTPYATEILGTGTQPIYDQAIQARIIDTPGVVSLDAYKSYRDQQRNLTVEATISTVYGSVEVTAVAPL